MDEECYNGAPQQHANVNYHGYDQQPMHLNPDHNEYQMSQGQFMLSGFYPYEQQNMVSPNHTLMRHVNQFECTSIIDQQTISYFFYSV